MTKRKRAERLNTTSGSQCIYIFRETSNKQLLTVDGRSFFFRCTICRSAIGQASSRLVRISAFNCALKFALCHRHSLHMVFACTLILRKQAPWTCFRPYSYFHQQTGNSKGARLVSSSLYSKLVKRSSSFVETRNKSWRFFMRLLLNRLI